MEVGILKVLLANDSVGWIGWAMVISVVIAFGVGLLTKSLIAITKNIRVLKKELAKPDYKKQILNENNVTQILRNIKHDLFADRVLVFQYHNGVHSIADNSLLKTSITHESLNRNVHSCMKEFQNIPSNYFGDWNNQIFGRQYIEIPDIDNEEDTTNQRSVLHLLQSEGVKSMYIFPIEDAMGNTFGMGMVQYIHKARELDPNWLEWARGRFNGVGALLAGVEKLESND